jgi:hypothetical protein
MGLSSRSIVQEGGVTISDSEPSNPSEGDLWKEPGPSALKVYDNGDWLPVATPDDFI